MPRGGGNRSEAKLSVEAGRELVLVGDARPWLDQWMQLRLFVRGADGVWAPWPVVVEGDAARAILPADAVEWEARWWSPAVAGIQRSTPVSDRAHGPVEGQGGARISAELPH
ncbi:MAG: hypothetical protein H6831_02135 [Planctomycetes bacterium]|nr:hypothetical protein [Planctomycetota bacterium]